MISLETKIETSASSLPIGIASSEEEPTISFSSLLKEVKLGKDEGIIQNGALVLSLKDEKPSAKELPKADVKETLLSLLKTDDKVSKKEQAPLEINSKIMQNMSTQEIKVLVLNAKEYLKEKILSSDEYKFLQLKELPKTLKGLTTLAQKLDINISKITIEEVQAKPLKKEVTLISSNKELAESEKASKELKIAPKEIKIDLAKEAKVVQSTPVTKSKNDMAVQRLVEDKNVEQPKQAEQIKQVLAPKETPLFKAQTTKEFTTEQLVATKSFKVEEKTPKTRADETLKMLLRAEKPSHSQANLTADFSVATAKVIAPSASTELGKSLESLLRDGSGTETSSKLDALTIHKVDSFEVKLNEAKQMIKYLSSDVKNAIEDYKSPFTRVKVQLNPAKLGEVDLTVIARGKNLIVTLSANNTAINTLSANVNELRVQLSNSGINNATFNFNDSSQNSEQNAQQQQRQKEQKADEEYNHFTSEEQNEEILSSLEIVVPNYA